MKKMGGWNVLLMVTGGVLFVALIFPVFATARAYSGPGMGPSRVANALDQIHRDTGKWPTKFEELQPLLRRRPSWREYQVTVIPIRLASDSAEYVIGVDGGMARFRTSNGRLELLKEPVMRGVLPATR